MQGCARRTGGVGYGAPGLTEVARTSPGLTLYIARNARLKLDESVSLQLHFLHSISRQRLIDEWVEILQRNQPPEALATLQTELDRSRSFFRDVQCGDTITLDQFVKGTGDQLAKARSAHAYIVGATGRPAYLAGGPGTPAGAPSGKR